MAALVIRAIDQQAMHASGSHFGEGDFLADRFWHEPLKREGGFPTSHRVVIVAGARSEEVAN
jgi:hypothetical protein